MTRLASPSKEAAGAMKELGFNAFDSQGKLKNLSTIMDEYNKALEGKTDQQKQDYTATIFGMEAMSGMLVLAGQGGEALDQLTQSYKNSDGAAKEMAATMKDNLKGSIDQLTGSLESLALQIYYSVDNPMKDIVDRANSMVSELSEAFKSGGFEGLTEAMGKVFAEIITDIAKNTPKVIDGAVSVLKAFIKGIKDNAATIATGATDIVTSLANGILDLTPTILDTGLILLTNLIKGLSDNLPTLLPRIVKFIEDLVKAITDNAPQLIEAGIQINLAIMQGMIKAIPEVLKAIPQINVAIIQAFAKADWSQIGKDILKGAFSVGATDGANAAEWIKSQVASIKTTFQTGGLKEAIKQVLATINPSLNDTGVNFATWAKAQVKSIKDAFTNGGLKEAVKQAINGLTPSVGGTALNIVNWIKPKIEAAKAEISKLKEEIPQKINEIFSNTNQAISSKFNEIVNDVVNFTKQLPYRVGEIVGEALTNIVKFAEDTKTTITETIPQVIDDVANWFSTLPTRIGEWLNTTINNFIAWGSNLISSAEESASNAINSIINWFTQLPSRVEEFLSSTINNIITFSSNMGTEATTAGQSFFDNIVNKVSEIPSKMSEIGGYIVQGLKNGIANSWNSMTGWLGGLCNDFVRGVEAKFEIKSPSRVFKRIGGFIMEGWQIGLVQNANNLIKSATNISSDLINSVQDSFKNVNLADSMLASIGNVKGTFATLKNQIDAAQKAVKDASEMKVENNYWVSYYKQWSDSVQSELNEIDNQADESTDKSAKKSLEYQKKQLENQKKYLNEEYSKAKEAAQKEIELAKETAKSQQEVAESNKNKLIQIAEATTEAIKNKLTEQKEAELKIYDDELTAMENKYNAEVEAIDRSTERKKAAIDRQIKELEAANTESTREEERQSSENNISKLETMKANTASYADKRSLQLQIDTAKKELNKKEKAWNIEDQKAQLEEEKALLDQRATNRKNSLKEDYEEEKKNIEDKKKATEEYYNKLLETEAINAQARYVLLTKSNEELVALLNSYAPQWQNAGQSLADSLLNGLNSNKQSIADAVAEMASFRGGSISGYSSGTSYNRYSGLYEVDEDGFELSSSDNAVAYVSQGAAINNHMQSLAAIKDEISKQIAPIYNNLKAALYSSQAKIASTIMNSTTNNSQNVNYDGSNKFNIENLVMNTGDDVEQFFNEAETIRLKNKPF